MLGLILLTGIVGWIFWPPYGPQSSRADASSADRAEAAESNRARTPVRVETVRVRRRDFSLRTEANGHLRPWREIELIAEVSGKVVRRPIKESRWVEQGALLIELDDQKWRSELREAEAELLRKLAEHAVRFDSYDSVPAGDEDSEDVREAALAEYARALELSQQGLISKQELDRARRRARSFELLEGLQLTDIQAATSGLVQAEQRVERARQSTERTRLVAPFQGRVADLDVEIGQHLSAGDVCLRLLDSSRLNVEVDVLEADVVWLREGAPARVRVPALDDVIFEGSISSRNPRIDTDTGTGKVTVALTNPQDRLIPGLFATVELETRRLEDRLVVPADAVLVREGRELVFRIEEGRAKWVYVTTGQRSRDQIEVLDGLEEGDTVVVAGHLALAHDAVVEAHPRPEAADPSG
ncbi:MAG: efflux RND transporter periplasmic adaptor subunit [bacterium]|nr:efflux RND transporter periplasmic adaptor subunit [bacterium]